MDEPDLAEQEKSAETLQAVDNGSWPGDATAVGMSKDMPQPNLPSRDGRVLAAELPQAATQSSNTDNGLLG